MHYMCSYQPLVGRMEIPSIRMILLLLARATSLTAGFLWNEVIEVLPNSMRLSDPPSFKTFNHHLFLSSHCPSRLCVLPTTSSPQARPMRIPQIQNLVTNTENYDCLAGILPYLRSIRFSTSLPAHLCRPSANSRLSRSA